ncbi:MAG: transporter [Verrucomicrobiae bacterium]|nr:transporter [Verrucomicrobiae bacterium]
MKTKILTRLLLAAGVFALAVQPQALPVGSHYPVGAEGIKGAALPPPGIYLRDYNFFYSAGKVDGLPADVDIFAYVQAPRLIWMTDKKILGANYGMDIIVPFAYKNVSLGGSSGDQFNIADIQVEPLLLAWHFKQFDLSAGYALWAPSGNFDASSPVRYLTSPGSGFWSHMLTFGGVWYPDEKKTWAVSLLNRYEICYKQDQTDITPGNMWTLEWGLSKTVAQGVDLGLIGYYQQQATDDSGAGASPDTARVIGVGPEVNVFWAKPGLFTSLRYVYEADARNRPQGHTVTLTVTKRF